MSSQCQAEAATPGAEGVLAPTYPSVEACAKEIGVSSRHLREQIRRNQFPHLRIGRRILLPRRAILDFLNRKALESMNPLSESGRTLRSLETVPPVKGTAA